jgi:hypothetical protein
LEILLDGQKSVVTFAIAVFFDVSNLLRILLVSQPFVLASVWCRIRLALKAASLILLFQISILKIN